MAHIVPATPLESTWVASGIQPETVREIALAWVLTLPVAMCLAGGLYWLSTMFVG